MNGKGTHLSRSGPPYFLLRIYAHALGTLGQHEFAFGFCGSVGVEISRVRKSEFNIRMYALPTNTSCCTVHAMHHSKVGRPYRAGLAAACCVPVGEAGRYSRPPWLV